MSDDIEAMSKPIALDLPVTASYQALDSKDLQWLVESAALAIWPYGDDGRRLARIATALGINRYRDKPPTYDADGQQQWPPA